MPRIKALDEAQLIASALYLQGWSEKQGKLYVLSGTDINYTYHVITGTSVKQLRSRAKTHIEAWKAEESQWGPYPKAGVSRTSWAQFSAARKQIIDNAHGDGTYDWVMKRILA